MSTLVGVAFLIAVLVLVLAAATAAYGFRRARPHIRDQGERLREDGGPRGADFDTYAAKHIERLPPTPGERDRFT